MWDSGCLTGDFTESDQPFRESRFFMLSRILAPRALAKRSHAQIEVCKCSLVALRAGGWRAASRTRRNCSRALLKGDTLYSERRASAGGTAMAWRAGNRQARNALRARSAEAANKLPYAKAFFMQW